MADESIGTARIDVTVNTATMEAGVEAAKRKVSGLGTQVSAEFDKANASKKRYAESLARQAELLGKSRAEQIAYNAQTRIGGALGDEIARKALANQAKLAASTLTVGKTAREVNFALRGLPAQFTDIATSLAQGQRPLQVFLQQGGQLKDMFGGIGPAAKALGGYVLGLINPFTIAAAAAAGLFVAWKEGSDEAVAYNKALITTGNYAGLTAGSMGDLAKSIDQTVGTQHEAAKALAEVAASGKFAGEQVGLVGKAALDMARLTGQATSETVKQFEELGKKPVEAVLKLNDAQHFLTLEVYEQIKALEDAGKTQEAASLAMRTYADTVSSRSKDAVENLGLIERAWKGIKDAALEAGDAALDVGRKESLAVQLKKANAAVDAREAELTPALGLNNPAGLFLSQFLPGGNFAEDKELQKLRADAARLQAQFDQEQREAAEKALQAKLVQDKADSDREAAAYFTNAQKRAQEYLRAENEFNERIARALKAGNAKLAEQERQQKAAVLAGINSKYADKGAAKRENFFSQSIGNDPRADLTASINAEIKGYGKEADAFARNGAAAVAYRQTLDDMLATRQRAIDLQVQSIGMGQREIDQQQALIAIDEDYNRKKADLQKRQQNTTSALEREGYRQQLDDLEKYHNDRIRMEVDGWRRAEEARKDAALGARAAIADFVDSAGNVAGQTYDLFSNAFDGMSDAIAKFVETGKLDFSDLANSIIADLAKMEARILVSQALQSIFGGTSTISGYDRATPQQQVAYDVAHGYAKGDVFANSPSLSAYSGGIYDRPHFFQFARGAGVFGEAGPEAIMPLTRGPNGKLGVQASGSGDVQVEVNITNNGQAVQARQTGTRRDGQKVIVDMVLDAVAGDIASGGKTAKAMQQRFGVQRRGVPVGA